MAKLHAHIATTMRGSSDNAHSGAQLGRLLKRKVVCHQVGGKPPEVGAHADTRRRGHFGSRGTQGTTPPFLSFPARPPSGPAAGGAGSSEACAHRVSGSRGCRRVGCGATVRPAPPRRGGHAQGHSSGKGAAFPFPGFLSREPGSRPPRSPFFGLPSSGTRIPPLAVWLGVGSSHFV